jgi:disulfide bond formation protein DsbB
MYPLSIILAIATVRKDKNIAYYVLPFSILGMMFSGYHYMEQKITAVGNIIPCTVGVPCTTEWINWFGFITIPFLALTAFTLITVTLIIMIKREKKQSLQELFD